MTDQVLSLVQKHAPWRAGTPWWATGSQGLVLLVIGIYFLAAPDSAGRLILQLVALAILAQSVLNIASGWRAPRGTVSPYLMVRSGVGATVGLLLVFRTWLLPHLDGTSARVILGLGLIAYVVIEVADLITDPERSNRWLAQAVNALLLIVLAIVILTSSADNAGDRLGVLGWIMIVGGILLFLVALRGYNRRSALVAPAEG
jgi:uncharacterized membrane protein HdeD (DUF308 family)